MSPPSPLLFDGKRAGSDREEASRKPTNSDLISCALIPLLLTNSDLISCALIPLLSTNSDLISCALTPLLSTNSDMTSCILHSRSCHLLNGFFAKTHVRFVQHHHIWCFTQRPSSNLFEMIFLHLHDFKSHFSQASAQNSLHEIKSELSKTTFNDLHEAKSVFSLFLSASPFLKKYFLFCLTESCNSPF